MGDQLQQALVDAANEQGALELLRRKPIPSELEIPFVGKFTREDNGTGDFTLDATPKRALRKWRTRTNLGIFAGGIARTATHCALT